MITAVLCYTGVHCGFWLGDSSTQHRLCQARHELYAQWFPRHTRLCLYRCAQRCQMLSQGKQKCHADVEVATPPYEAHTGHAGRSRKLGIRFSGDVHWRFALVSSKPLPSTLAGILSQPSMTTCDLSDKHQVPADCNGCCCLDRWQQPHHSISSRVCL